MDSCDSHGRSIMHDGKSRKQSDSFVLFLLACLE